MEPNCGACGFPQSEHRIGHSRYRCHFVLPAPTATPPARLTDEQMADIWQIAAAARDCLGKGIAPSTAMADDLTGALVSVLNDHALLVAEWRAGRADKERLDWWAQHIHDGPSIGLFTDGRLGLGRGHVVDSRWTVKGVGYTTLREAIDAARQQEAKRV